MKSKGKTIRAAVEEEIHMGDLTGETKKAD
jgi:hypothetical protein